MQRGGWNAPSYCWYMSTPELVAGPHTLRRAGDWHDRKWTPSHLWERGARRFHALRSLTKLSEKWCYKVLENCARRACQTKGLSECRSDHNPDMSTAAIYDSRACSGDLLSCPSRCRLSYGRDQWRCSNSPCLLSFSSDPYRAFDIRRRPTSTYSFPVIQIYCETFIGN